MKNLGKTLAVVGAIVIGGAGISALSSSGNSVATSPQTYTAPVEQTAPAAVQKTSNQQAPYTTNNYYTNVDGNTVHGPTNTIDGSVPSGATAQCGDGTYSFSQHRSGTCSHHGGVNEWL